MYDECFFQGWSMWGGTESLGLSVQFSREKCDQRNEGHQIGSHCLMELVLKNIELALIYSMLKVLI